MDARQDYLLSELWILAWNGSVQRAKLYKEDREPATQLFRDKIVSHLTAEIIPRYCQVGMEDEQHYKHIDELADYANSVGDKVLGHLGYKYYGVAQKLLNLALKYHWCLGVIAEPPHCPVDRIVIDQTTYKGKINWTEIKYRSEYQCVIEDIRRKAGPQSIAMWELSIYNRRQASGGPLRPQRSRTG
jgi:hypothetical protein